MLVRACVRACASVFRDYRFHPPFVSTLAPRLGTVTFLLYVFSVQIRDQDQQGCTQMIGTLCRARWGGECLWKDLRRGH